MADDVDNASEKSLREEEMRNRAYAEQAARIPVGEPGICEECEEHFSRLVEGRCGRCRDELAGVIRR